MKKIPIYAVAGICIVTAFLWSGISVGEVDNGKQIYMDKCQLCHGVKGDGKGQAAAFLGSKPADFTDPKFWETEDEKKMAETIDRGRGEMPAFDLKPNEMKAVIDYITHSFKPQKK